MLVKVSDANEVVKWPYTIAMLRKENPNTSFPVPVSVETLKEYNLYKVINSIQPSCPIDKIAVVDPKPSYIDDQWTITWSIRDLNEDEVESLKKDQRNVRDNLLAETDWWAVSDRTMSSAQTTYRQALRDVTTHSNWPYLKDDDWPTKPS